MSNGSFIDDLVDIPGLNDMSRKSRDRGLRVTGEDADGDYDDSGDDLGTRAKAERPTFPCESCGGTGIYRGVRVHQEKTQCFACKGKGFFYQSKFDRMAKRAKSAARKQKAKDDNKAAFIAEHAALHDGMRKHASWNEFLARLCADLDAGKRLSENAIAAAQRSVDKANARDAERDAQRATAQQARLDAAPVVNVSAIHDAFAAAIKSELKVPMLRYDGFNVKLSKKDSSTLFVRSEGGFGNNVYYGKIVNGKFLATREAEAVPGLVAKVVEAMNDPLAAAIAYGRKLGNCSCCGRRLVDPVSVANGIGPVCAERYGWDRIVPQEVADERAAKAAAKAERAARKTQSKEVAVSADRVTKYEYAPGMTDAEKRKLRAAARRAARAAQ